MNKLLLLLLGSTVGLGLISLHLVNLLREERDASKALQARIEALQDTRRQPPPATAVFSVVPTAPAVEPATSSPPSAAAMQSRLVGVLTTAARELPAPQVPSQEDHERVLREHMERQRALMQNPEYREAMKAQAKMMLTRTYPDLDREMGLDEEQYDQLLSLLADQQLRVAENDVSRATDTDFREMQRKVQQQQQTNDAELAVLLGSEKLSAWKDYQSTMGVRYQVTQMRSTLAAAGAPLEQSQVKPLLKAMAKEQQQAQEQMMKEYQKQAQGGGAQRLMLGPGGDPTASQLKWQEQALEQQAKSQKRLRNAVASILTAEQLRELERDQNEQLRMQEVQMRMMRAQAEAAARGELPNGPQGGSYSSAEAIAVPIVR